MAYLLKHMRFKLNQFIIYKQISHRCVHTSNKINITLTDDGSTIVCLHPEAPFPYEHTKELPQVEDDLKESESVLKIQYRIEAENMYNDGPDTEELQMLTFTPKWKWDPKGRQRPNNRKVPLPPHPREGI